MSLYSCSGDDNDLFKVAAHNKDDERRR